MSRPVYLVFLLLMVVLVSSSEDSISTQEKVELSSNNANDLDADASSYLGYYRRHGWSGGYGWGGSSWGGRQWGRGWNVRGAWW